MKEFVEKLIERLEGVKVGVNGLSDIVWNNAVKMCIREINDLASEHNNDICEWKYDGTIYDRCPHKETLFARIHNCNEKIFKFCPYCGKKIKVVPAPYRKGE